MSKRRFVPLALAVAGLLAVAALASHGRPLSTSRGTGPTAHFFDYVFTTIVLVGIAIGVLFLVGIFGSRPATPNRPRRRWYPFQLLLSFVTAALFGFLLFHARLHQQKKTTTPSVQPAHTAGRGAHALPPAAHPHGARLRWDEVAIVGLLLAAAGVAAFASRRPPGTKEWRFGSRKDDVSAALDESLDDLRADPDLRRAIIAAYARMERALAGAGMQRRPAEAPREYLARALAVLDVSGASVERLTDLFEWAKFSHHEPDVSMRDEAVDALVAVRDELRRPVIVAV